jgi:release factor glutamine methyltransferase
MSLTEQSVTRKQWLDTAAKQIFQALAESHQLSLLEAKREAMLLLCHGLMINSVSVRTWPEQEIPEQALPIIDNYLQRRLAGEPIAYIIGYKEFWSMKLDVNDAVLIPRPETEMLVEQALAIYHKLEQQAIRILDLGTGSGAIALAIASECSEAQVVAVDASAKALAVAQHNAHKFQLSNVSFIESSWYEQLTDEQPFDIILSNPPYIAPNDPHLYQGDLPYEPDQALAAEEQGFSDLQTIIRGAKRYLVPGGALLLEHGFEQAEKVQALLQAASFTKVASIRDLADHQRISLGFR